jgi:hypothetical protein
MYKVLISNNYRMKNPELHSFIKEFSKTFKFMLLFKKIKILKQYTVISFTKYKEIEKKEKIFILYSQMRYFCFDCVRYGLYF